ncbi:MAG: hypothetical protein OQJ97_10115 [Rhodospirillales bacterium]|nr:hypothetical protein [Rhodospirillales bacterium]
MKPTQIYDRKRGRRSLEIRDSDVAKLIDELLIDPLTIVEIMSKVKTAFGDNRTPSRSAIHRFVQRRTKEFKKAERERPERTEAEWRFQLIRPILDFPKHSYERGAAIREVSRFEHTDHKGRKRTITAAQIRRWISTFETSKIGFLDDV